MMGHTKMRKGIIDAHFLLFQCFRFLNLKGLLARSKLHEFVIQVKEFFYRGFLKC